jgi:hypothetical protein
MESERLVLHLFWGGCTGPNSDALETTSPGHGKKPKKTSKVAMVAPKIHEKPMIYQLYHHNPHDMSIFYVFFSFLCGLIS